MRGYKYVKFSRGTAKISPNMILREYDRVVEKSKDKYEYLGKHVNAFNIKIFDSVFNQINTLIAVGMPIPQDIGRDLRVHLSYEEVKEAYFKLERQHAGLIKAKEIHDLIKKERGKFRNRFVLKK